MKTTVVLLLIPIVALYGIFPAHAGDQELRGMIQKAMDNGTVLRVKTSVQREVIGKVVSLQEKDFTILNPQSKEKSWVLWSKVQQVREIQRITAESQPWFESLAGRQCMITVRLLDGSKYKGRIQQVDIAGLTLQKRHGDPEVGIAYDDMLVVDEEPTGQKTIRKIMIGAAVGLASVLIIFAYMMRGD